MSLPHAILGFLEYSPMSGYDLKRNFDQSVAHFWSATQSHIYKALEELENQCLVTSEIIEQEGKPNRKQYRITDTGRTELRRWLATPLPMTGPRSAWLIQVFFAHELANEEIANLFEKRAEQLRAHLLQLQSAQKFLHASARQIGVKRAEKLWQLTLDYGIDNYTSEIRWLERMLPAVRRLPPLTAPKR